MIIDVPRGHSDAIPAPCAPSPRSTARVGCPADERTLAAAAAIVFGRADADGPCAPVIGPSALARTLTGSEERRQAARFLAVMALVDGRVDKDKLGMVARYAAALDIHEDYLAVLAETAEGEIATAAACMIRKSTESFPGSTTRWISWPIRSLRCSRTGTETTIPCWAARYEALGEAPAATFGRAFFDHFDRNGFAFPGHPNALAEGFTTPHDSSHVLAGYSTTEIGELCVSTFIGAMHSDHPMAAEVLPVIYSWHLGIKLNEIARSTTGVFEPRRFSGRPGNAARRPRSTAWPPTGTSGRRHPSRSRICAGHTGSHRSMRISPRRRIRPIRADPRGFRGRCAAAAARWGRRWPRGPRSPARSGGRRTRPGSRSRRTTSGRCRRAG